MVAIRSKNTFGSICNIFSNVPGNDINLLNEHNETAQYDAIRIICVVVASISLIRYKMINNNIWCIVLVVDRIHLK